MELSKVEISVLQALLARSTGEQAFVSIAGAQALTGRGLARRSRQGWTITADGSRWLEEGPGAAPSPRGDILPFAARTATSALQ
jgi:hypothetical protein